MTGHVSVNVSLLPKVCFALQQNDIPLIRQLTVRNEAEHELTDVRCVISSSPSFLENHEQCFSSLTPRETLPPWNRQSSAVDARRVLPQGTAGSRLPQGTRDSGPVSKTRLLSLP